MRFKHFYIKIGFCFGLLQSVLLVTVTLVAAQRASSILYKNGDRLTYVTDEEENRIPDFSHAGYRGGGVEIPFYPVARTVSPQSGDDTKRIKNAIEYVENLPPDHQGIRGAVYLKAGTYQVSDNLHIRKSGVVLRGAGSGSDPRFNTILKVSKNLRGTVLEIGNSEIRWYDYVKNTHTRISTDFIPVGARNFEVEDIEPFEVGDNIIVRHNSSQEWLDAIDGGGTDTDPRWEEGHIEIYYNRTITGIKNNIISIDAPVFNHLDNSLSRTRVYKLDRGNLVTESGVEYLQIEIETNGENSDTHAENGVIFSGIENGWANYVTVLHFSSTGFGTFTANKITIQNCMALEPHSELTGERRYNFNAQHFSNNILFDSVISSKGRRSFISNGTSVASGIVFLNSRSIGAITASEGHQKWSQGLLYDNVTFENPQYFVVLGLYNRGNLGTSHGWGAVHSVAWNVDTNGQQIIIQKPPTAQNYGIGNQGIVTGQGLFDHPAGYIEGTNSSPLPASLYRAQLNERLDYGVPPDIPSRFSISDQKKNQLVLSWKHLSVNDAEIIIERSSDGGNHFNEIDIVENGDSTYVDNNLDEQTYHYRIRARDKNGPSGYTYTVSGRASFTNDYIPDFALTLPLNKASYSVENKPDDILSFFWKKGKTALDLTYTWILDRADGDFSNPIAQIESNTNTTFSLTNRDILNLLSKADITFETEYETKWTVKANSKNLEKWASDVHSLFFTKQKESEVLIEDNKKTELSQNFPNPFNPVTTIRFYLEEESDIELDIFDLAGIKVATIDKGLKGEGYHELNFDGRNLASGVYIYRLKTKNFVTTRKMILVK